ncbi:guanylyltransferase [Methanobrevibacter sp. TMH8]|uniref:tRNA(His) guanylyltransferase Thg1 family protein n=1 Tax=Methanobrevibacter sp. TMH8 TaxID=2848611 RepID=UPI0021062BA1|nr:tRNA(His) guanylyltransferase Thg1 family protein [Methanobrevibacter sp. TMH8]MBZ9569962.1 guanylyltransferase [Methanobrevibacter sp. TMH8]
MKEYEIYNSLKVPKGFKIILRLDGRKFHSLTNNLNLEMPYDEKFINAMIDTSKDIFNEFSPSFIYSFSDEINILLSEIPFSGRIEKLNSVFPSLASSALTLHLKDLEENFTFNKNISTIPTISFDSRVIPIANNGGIVKYFKWRQDEAWRNCINSYGYWTLRKDFSAKEATMKLKNLKSSDIHEILFKKGLNINNLPIYQKRGVAIYKTKKQIKGLNPKTNKEENSFRNLLFVDKKLPIFDKDFFKKIDII